MARMQPEKSKVEAIVSGAVDEVNKQLRRSRRLGKSRDTMLSGETGGLDSLGLVNLVFVIEQKVEQEFSVSVCLADEEAIEPENGPFLTLGSLTDHLQRVLEKAING